MNIPLTPNELKTIAEHLCVLMVPRFDALVQQTSKASHPSLVVLTVKDVAEQLQFSEKTIHKYIGVGRLRASNLGTPEKPVWRMSQQAVQEFFAA